jgi:hypothetical protein
VALPFYIEKYLKAKEELQKLKYFTIAKKYNLPKTLPKETKILQDSITSMITKLKVSTQAKNIIFQKNPHIKKKEKRPITT